MEIDSILTATIRSMRKWPIRIYGNSFGLHLMIIDARKAKGIVIGKAINAIQAAIIGNALKLGIMKWRYPYYA